MPLKLVLKSGDRIVLNGAVVENAGADAELLLLNQASVLRGKDVLSDEDAATPAARVYMALQLAYLFPDRREEHLLQFRTFARQYTEAAPSATAIIDEVEDLISKDRFYPALKASQKLIAHEAGVLAAFRTQLASKMEREQSEAEGPVETAGPRDAI